MKFYCSKNVDYSKAFKITDYYTDKVIKRIKAIKEDMVSVWIKKVNPENSAGVLRYKCRVELKFNGKEYFAEHSDENLKNTIRQPLDSLMQKIKKGRYNQKEIRNFKRFQLATIKY